MAATPSCPRIACISRLASALPATMAGPESPPAQCGGGVETQAAPLLLGAVTAHTGTSQQGLDDGRVIDGSIATADVGRQDQ